MKLSQITARAARRYRRAFTIIELLVVIGIIGLMLAFVVPAASGIMSGFTLTQHGQDLMDKVSLCRQLAMTQNREAELRIIKVGGSGGADDSTTYAYQIWMYDEQGGNPVPHGRIAKIPETIEINDTLSPMLDLLVTGQANFPALGGARTYEALRYRVNGTALGTFGANNYLTLSYKKDEKASPKNFYTIQVNPITGLISVFRP